MKAFDTPQETRYQKNARILYLFLDVAPRALLSELPYLDGNEERLATRGLPIQSGSFNFARQPDDPARFSRVSDPPWASAIWRLSARPMPEPPGFVVKKGTNRFVAPEMPGPSSSMRISTLTFRF